MSEVLINRVTESALSSLDLEEFLPKEEIVFFDLKPFLFMELLLKEKDFRAALKVYDFSVFAGKHVGIMCSSDAIIPMWAYMLLGSYLQPVAASVHYTASEQGIIDDLVLQNIRKIDLETFRDKRVVVKGCGDKPVGEKAYLEITVRLRPVVKSIMYGEPCSTVPVYKQALKAAESIKT